MDSRAVALVLAAAVFHAAWNVALHRGTDRAASMAIASLAGGAMLCPALFLAFPSSVLGLAAISAVAETAYGLTLARSYASGDLSVAYPIGRGTSPLLVTVLGIAVLNQKPSLMALGGALSLAAGLIILATQRSARRHTVVLALVVGACIAGYSVVDARAVQHANPLAYLSLVLLLAGTGQAGVIGFDLRRLRAAASQGALIGLGSITSYALVLVAFTLGAAGRVSTLREFAVLLGMAAVRERPGRRAWLGAALVVAGAILAAL